MKHKSGIRRWIAASAVAGLATLIAVPVFAGGDRRQARQGRAEQSDERRADRMADRMANRLGLDELQKENVARLMERHRDEMRAKDQEMMQARMILKDKIHAAPFDEGAIRAAAGEVAGIDADRAVARGKLMEQMRNVLTEEQYAEFIEMDDRRGPRMGRFGPGKPGPDGRGDRLRRRDRIREHQPPPNKIDEEDPGQD